MQAADVAGDGSPVAVYGALPAEPELGMVRRYAEGRASVLDLGCGTGRIADPLATDGHLVVAVDEFPGMLELVQQASTVQSRVETLALVRRFDLVLLLSHLVNAPTADALLDTAARHVAPDGLVLIQRLLPGRSWEAGASQLGEVILDLEDVSVDGRSISATSVCSLGTCVWRQRWTLHNHTDEELVEALRRAHLEPVEIDGRWVVARPVSSAGG